MFRESCREMKRKQTETEGLNTHTEKLPLTERPKFEINTHLMKRKHNLLKMPFHPPQFSLWGPRKATCSICHQNEGKSQICDEVSWMAFRQFKYFVCNQEGCPELGSVYKEYWQLRKWRVWPVPKHWIGEAVKVPLEVNPITFCPLSPKTTERRLGTEACVAWSPAKNTLFLIFGAPFTAPDDRRLFRIRLDEFYKMNPELSTSPLNLDPRTVLLFLAVDYERRPDCLLKFLQVYAENI